MSKTYLGEFSKIDPITVSKMRAAATKIDTVKRTTYPWQDTAVRMWNKLGLKPPINSSFMRCFKLNEGKAEGIAYDLSDGDFRNTLKMFFWKWNHV